MVGRMRHFIVAFGTAACVAGAWNAAASAADDLDREALTNTAAREATMDAAVRVYASDFGVSEMDARKVLEEQAKGKDLGDELPKALGDSFSQLTFVDGHYKVYVTEGATEKAQQVLAKNDLAQTSTVREVPWNADDLTSSLRRTSADLAARLDTDKFLVRTDDGKLAVELAPSAGATATEVAAAAARETKSDRQVPVEIVQSEHEFGKTDLQAYHLPGYGGPPWIAGMGNKSLPDSNGYSIICTTGFYTRAVGNFFLTAGHCLYQGHYIRQVCYSYMNCINAGRDVGGYVHSGGDAGVIASWDTMPPYPALLNWMQPTYVGVAVFGAATSVYGKYYCRTGIGSASVGHSATTCGTNYGLGIVHDPAYPAGGITAQTLRGNVCAFDGDSGGPVWDITVGYAIGIHNASIGGPNNGDGCGTNMTLFYTDAVPAAAALGVTIATL